MQHAVTPITSGCLPHSFPGDAGVPGAPGIPGASRGKRQDHHCSDINKECWYPGGEFEKAPLTFTSVGANLILVGFVFQTSFCTACLKSENLRIVSFLFPAYWESFKPEFCLCVDRFLNWCCPGWLGLRAAEQWCLTKELELYDLCLYSAQHCTLVLKPTRCACTKPGMSLHSALPRLNYKMLN